MEQSTLTFAHQKATAPAKTRTPARWKGSPRRARRTRQKWQVSGGRRPGLPCVALTGGDSPKSVVNDSSRSGLGCH
jgi:hypothetical protein